ncbi:hypothetical protein GJR98_12035 [Haloferax sp. MBLA0077]|uniref:Uncharacterized protein n=2 Tax=Haloferax TaxID=2251 RepID=A0A6G1Z4T5_9EURY|nr:hypothetical protein Hfx1149_12050 [Haloferax sp. CBA1149]MRW81438.1 hypothetical protein [Haloferax marinisediminis]
MSVSDGVDTSATSDNEPTPTPIGVKLGSDRTVVVFRRDDGKRETIRTRSCLAVSDESESDDYLASGEEAETQYPDQTTYVLSSGLPGDAARAELTEQFFHELCTAHDLPEHSAVVYAIPMVDDEVGLANLSTLVKASDIGDVLARGYPESLCGSIPALSDDLAAMEQIFAAINLGATTLEACAYRRGEQLSPFSSTAATGDTVDHAIVDAIAAETDGRVELSPVVARGYKETHADFDSFEPFTDVVSHSDDAEHEFTVEAGVMGPLETYLDDVVDELTAGFFSRLATEHMRSYQLSLTRPLVVTGGMACIPGLTDELASRLSEELDRSVTVVTADDPDLAAAEGAFRIADRLASTH